MIMQVSWRGDHSWKQVSYTTHPYKRVERTILSGALWGSIQNCAIVVATDAIGAFEVAILSLKIKHILGVELRTTSEGPIDCKLYIRLFHLISAETCLWRTWPARLWLRDGTTSKPEKEEIQQRGGRGGGEGDEGGEDADGHGDLLHLRPNAMLLLCPLHGTHGRRSLLCADHGGSEQNQAQNGLKRLSKQEQGISRGVQVWIAVVGFFKGQSCLGRLPTTDGLKCFKNNLKTLNK